MEENVYFKEERKNGEGKVRKCHFLKEKKRHQRKKKGNICRRNVVYKLRKGRRRRRGWRRKMQG